MTSGQQAEIGKISKIQHKGVEIRCLDYKGEYYQSHSDGFLEMTTG